MFSRIEKNPEYKKQQKETKLQQCFKNMMEQISRLWIDLSDCVEKNRVNRPTGNFDVKYSRIMNNAMTM